MPSQGLDALFHLGQESRRGLRDLVQFAVVDAEVRGPVPEL